MPSLHQFVAGFANGDAISNEAVVLQRVFRDWGFESEIFSEPHRILPELRRHARDVAQYVPAARPDDVVLLHLSIGSAVNHAFRSINCRKAILYHNVTPAHYFELVNRQTARDLARGRSEVALLRDAAGVNLADSRFNASELEELGYRDVAVFPLALDLDRLDGKPDAATLRKFSDGKVNVLFVGRCAPNKRIEDLLRAFAVFHKFVEPNSRLVHVGSFAGTERYYYLLLTQARELGLTTACFEGSVTESRLAAFYRVSHVFLCMSEHEGFCIPLIESMARDIPVLAYAAGAVPETLDGAGVLFRDKQYEPLAEMMGRLAPLGDLREAVVRRQRERVRRYRERDLAAEIRRHLAPLLP